MLPEHRRMANSVSDFLKNKSSNIMSERLSGSCFKVSYEACLKIFFAVSYNEIRSTREKSTITGVLSLGSTP